MTTFPLSKDKKKPLLSLFSLAVLFSFLFWCWAHVSWHCPPQWVVRCFYVTLFLRRITVLTIKVLFNMTLIFHCRICDEINSRNWSVISIAKSQISQKPNIWNLAAADRSWAGRQMFAASRRVMLLGYHKLWQSSTRGTGNLNHRSENYSLLHN